MVEPTTVAVHRCRFVDYIPSAITALAFTPLPLPSVKGKASTTPRQPLPFGTLAIGHANGNIDLCEWSGTQEQIQSSQAWVVRKTLAGPHPSKVDSLAFAIRYPEKLSPNGVPTCSDLRLFSSGGGTKLLEWDLERGFIKGSADSQGGSIWSMAVNPASSLLALGCEDGTVRLLSLVHDSLTHYRKFDRVKSRILSIAWGPPTPRQTTSTETEESSDDDEEDWNDVWLVTGCSDSSLRKWEVATGRVVDRLGVDKIRGDRTLVWTVGVLGDGTIVSGDSMGNVKFWDSRTCTQLQSFPAHGADVLCLAFSPEGTAVYSSGVDQKITQFTFVKTSNMDSSSSTRTRASTRWIQSCSRRMHSHDVRALAMWPPYIALPSTHRRKFSLDIAPILASGGLDMSVVLTPAALPTSTVVKVLNPLNTSTHATYEDAYHRKLAYTSGPSSTSAISISRQDRLLCCMRDTELSLWRIYPKPSVDGEVEARHMGSPNDGGWEKVLDMELKAHTNLVSSKLSPDGRWLVVSDLYESRLFSIEVDGQGGIFPKRVKNFSATIKGHISNKDSWTGGLAFAFTPDSTKLIMFTSFSSHVLVIDLSIEMPTVLRRFDQHRMQNAIIGSRTMKGRTIFNTEEAEDDGEEEDDRDESPVMVSILRMAVSADGQWLATSDEHCRTHVFNLDSLQHHCILPSFPQPAQFLAFDPNQPNNLLLAFPNNTLQIYNVESRQFPAWSKEFCSHLPKRFTHAHDPVLGVTFDPAFQAGMESSLMMVDSLSPSSSRPRYALFWGSTWICKMRFDPSSGEALSKKRRREGQKLNHTIAFQDGEGAVDQPHWRDFKMITHYRPILFADFIASGELVVVERPLVDVLATLPPAYFKPKYGAT